ncbi:hypothetical protein RJ639_047549 [Escallonia herrerae]|uniref:Uncharacterized protein n=1 Tax=Escallonia herrerae TaxID=1293975 RepID=A0AA88W7L1_9ASTE|nr:hypothetical protein RJ639_047549 [Escallonia herrerae]
MEHGCTVPPVVDKSRVLDVRPLRCLKPEFLSPPQAPPFVCAPPFGPFPPGFSPIYPFSTPQGSQISPDQNRQNSAQTRPTSNQEWGSPLSQPGQTPPGPARVHAPAPIRSYRKPNPESETLEFSGASNGDVGFSMENGGQKRKKTKRIVDGKGLSKDFVVGHSWFQRDDGNREAVDYALMAYDALRRRLSQVEDAKEAPGGGNKSAHLTAGKILMSKGVRTNMKKRIGLVPGVEIGDVFFFRFEMCLVGLHSQPMNGIDTMALRGEKGEEPVAISIVSSGVYDDDAEDKDVLIYSGQGGNVNNKDKEVADQKLERGNLALERSLHHANAVRVIRGMKDTINQTAKVYVYDGLYTIRESWTEKGKSGCNIFKYKLVRLPGQTSAFAIWQSLRKWKEGLTSRTGLVLPDLTSGAESIPVSLVNEVDDEKGPAYFTYFPGLKYSKSFKLLQPSLGCNCHKACLPGDLNCSCIRQNGGDFPYTANGVLVSRTPLVHECGPTCPCFPNCKNRVSQTGLKLRMEVFKTTSRGWGLRSWDPIRAGSFICEFAGEVIESLNGNEEENDEYVFDTNRRYNSSFKWNYEPKLLDKETTDESTEEYKIPSRLVISAKTVGNVARFLNHSCCPNVFWQPVIYEHNNESFLHIAFFAIKHIPPMTELTYDYGITQSETQGKKKCLCASSKCRGYFG